MLKARGRLGCSTVALCAAVLAVSAAQTLYAQEPPPRIGPFVVDVRGITPKFGDSPDLASSRDVNAAQLPGLGLGLTVGAHVYLPKVLGLTVGVGGEGLISRARTDTSEPIASATPGAPATTLPGVTETLKSISPQISLNFGHGRGWSYLSVGIGRSHWSIVPDGGTPRPVDEESIRTINYGGGARWFIKPHLAFSLDVRLYEIDEGTAVLSFPGSPRANLLVIGAGISTK